MRFGSALFLTLAAAVIGTGGAHAVRAGAPSRPTVTITITDSGYDAPTTIPAGYTAITIVNAGTMPHEASFVRVNPGVTLDQVISGAAAAINNDDVAPFVAFLQLVQFAGGVSGIAPGASAQYVANFTPGTYAFADTEHFSEGLFASLTVSGPAVETTPPLSDVTVTEREFAFDAPSTVRAGTATFEVRNTGQQTHELSLMTLDPGYTVQDVLAALQQGGQDEPPPPWIHEATSIDSQGPGTTQWVTLDLTPGTYVMLCFMPDVNTGQPHAFEGMVGTFTAQ